MTHRQMTAILAFLILLHLLYIGLIIWLGCCGPRYWAAITVVSVIGSSVYATYIYHRPSPAGWTWVSVVWGNVLVELATSAFIAAVLWDAGLLDVFWFIILAPWVSQMVWGIPMIIGQVLKLLSQLVENGDLPPLIERILEAIRGD